MAANVELNSFIAKFRYLCCAGFKASLTLKSEDGQAHVLFDVNLGALPAPVTLPPPGYCKKPRSPAYFRRQEKRRQERTKNEAGEAKKEPCNVDAKSVSIEEAGVAAEMCLMEDVNNKSEIKDRDLGRDILEKSTCENQNITANDEILAEESIDQDEENYFDEQEAAQDKLVDKIFVYATPEPTESLGKVEIEVREKFARINGGR